jgi:hypothetical protein
MNTQLVAGLSILVLLVGVVGVTSGHYAEAKGMPIHNPNWASVVANPTTQNGHAPAYGIPAKVGSSTSATDSKNMPAVQKVINSTPVQKNKDVPTAQNVIKTKPMQQKINRENQLKSESAKIANDQAKSNALIKANTYNSDIKVHQKPKL